MNALKDLLAGSNMSKKDFLDLVKTQFGDAAQAEIDRLMAQGMTMQVYLKGLFTKKSNFHSKILVFCLSK